MKDEKSIPVLKCYQGSPTQVKAWCPFCVKWHTHGYRDGIRSGRIGHWVAHCTDKNSPLMETGYYLTMLTKSELKAIASAAELYPKRGS